MKKSSEKILILHLEDDPNDSELVINEFYAAGIDIRLIRVDTERQFIENLDQHKIDIVLADYQLPGYDGISALGYCNKNYPDIPFIIVSGALGEEKAINLLKLGASDYLLKDNLIRLVPAVENSIKERRLRQEKMSTEANLKASEEKYRKIFENVQDVFYQVDKDGIITEISPSVRKVSGYAREELIGKPVELFYVSPDERDRLQEKLSLSGEVWDYELRLKEKDGSIRYTSINAHLTLDPYKNPSGIEGSIRDIDRRKRYEFELEEARNKAQESDRLKTAFLHNISHEVRTPMNAIIGFSTLLGEPDLSLETRQSFIKIIQESSNQLLSILNDIVDISHIETGIIKKKVEIVNINSTLQSLFNQFKLKSLENKNTLQISLHLKDEDANIRTDGTRLTQIISNLLSNAIKFTVAGQIRFGYTLNDHFLEFFVSDTGIGIAQDQQDRIFESFYQVDNDLTRRYGGTGLGLSLCRAYVELLGGKIWVDSESGKGSTFFFTLPYLASDFAVESQTDSITINS
jgi:PAS domain S-box-containing protein